MSSDEINEVQVQNMQKEVVLHQPVVDLWHNLLGDVLDTAYQAALSQGWEGTGKKEEKKERKKRDAQIQRLYLQLLKTVCKSCPSDPR